MRLHELHEEMDANNRRVFEEFDIDRSSELPIFRCVVCGGAVSIDESFSCRGHNLICRGCAQENGLLDSADKVLEFTLKGAKGLYA